MLQDRLDRIREFFQSIEQYDGKWVICVKYRPKWGAYPSEDGKIKAVPDEKTPDIWWYYGNNDKVDIDSIFDLIDETIQTNLDAVRKVELFKLKADELKRIFSDETIPFSKLQTLEFTFSEGEGKKDVKAKKTKSSRKTRPMTKKDILKIDDKVAEEKEPYDVVQKDEKSEVQNPSAAIQMQDSETVSATDLTKEEIAETVSATDLTKEEIDDLRG